MKKRLLALLVSTMLLLGMASAGMAEGNTEPVKITFWHSMSDEAGTAMDQIVADFNSGIGQDLNIEVEAVFQGSYSDSTGKMRTILQTEQIDQLPDVMQIDATGMSDYQATEYQYTVDQAIANDTSFDLATIMEVPLMNWNFSGVQLGLPVAASTTVMYYNKTMLDAAGAAAPTTFQEIVDLAALLPETTEAGQPIYALAAVPNTPSLANWIGQIPGAELNASDVTDNRNGRAGTATKLICDSEGTLALFLTEWKNMYDSGALLNQSSGLSDLFLTGQLALYPTSSSNTTTLLERTADTFELGCTYFPRVTKDCNYGATISGSGVFMFDKGNEAAKTAAWEFAKYLVSADTQAALSIATGYFPVNVGSYETDAYAAYAAKYPQMDVAVNQVQETSADMVGIIVGPSWDFYMDMMDIISAGLENGDTVEDIASALADDLNGVLAEYLRSNQ